MEQLGLRERRKVATHRDLVAAGRAVFGGKGLYEARIEDLTREAGIAKGTLYQYFASKEDLVQVVVAECLDALHQSVQEQLGNARALEDVAAAIVEGHLRFYDAQPDALRILHQARGMLTFDRREWRRLRSLVERHLQRLAEILRTRPRPPLLDGEKARSLAILLFGAVSGVSSVRVGVEPGKALAPWCRKIVPALAAAAAVYDGKRREGPGGTAGKAEVFGRVGGRRPTTRRR